MIEVLRLSSLTCAFLSWLTVGLFSNLVEGPEPAHPYHVSYAEVAFNSDSGNFEVSLCVWPTDLEKAIRAQEGKAIDLEKTEGLDPMIAKYIERRFFIRPLAEQTKGQGSDDAGKDLLSQPKPHRATNNSDAPAEQGLENLVGDGKQSGLAKRKQNDAEQVTSSTTKPTDKSGLPTASDNPSQVIPEGQPATDSIVDQPKATPGSSVRVSSSQKDASGNAKPAESRIRWVGHELDRRNVWLYFEVKGGENAQDITDWTLENRIFTELNEDQLNHIQWSLNRQKYETFVCNRQKLRHRISTKKLLQKQ